MTRWFAAFGLVVCMVGCRRDVEREKRAAVPVDGHLRIEANEEGFSPATVAVQKGQKLTLDFIRTSQNTCATEVVFPEIDVKQDLPLATVVPIEVPTGDARTLTFQCGMGMYKSKVVIQ